MFNTRNYKSVYYQLLSAVKLLQIKFLLTRLNYILSENTELDLLQDDPHLIALGTSVNLRLFNDCRRQFIKKEATENVS